MSSKYLDHLSGTALFINTFNVKQDFMLITTVLNEDIGFLV